MSIGKINYKKILYRIEKFYSSFFFVNHTVGRQPGTLQIDAFKLWRLRRGAVSLAQGGFGVVRVPWHRVRGLIVRRSARFFRDFGGGGAGHLLLPATVKLVVPRGGSFVLSDGVRQTVFVVHDVCRGHHQLVDESRDLRGSDIAAETLPQHFH